MKEIITQWKYTKMVVLTALTAAVYAAVMFPFKVATIVPGFTEIRPGVVVPIVFGLFFGPAGAWGSAMGNVIGDLFGGMFSIASTFGFVGNFLLGFMGYKMRQKLGWLSVGEGMGIKSFKDFLQFFLIVILSSAACATTIAWGLDVLKILPFAVMATIIFLNNAIMPAVIGPFLFLLLNKRLDRWDLIWTDIMDERDRSKSRLPILGSSLMWIGALGGLVIGILISSGVYKADIFADFLPGQMEGIGSTGILIFGVVASILMIIGAIL